MINTFTILIWISKSRINKKQKAPIYGRITVNGERAEISLKHFIETDKWNGQTGVVRGFSEEAKMINTSINNFKIKMRKIYEKLIESEELFTAETIKNKYFGIDDKSHTLIFVFDKHLRDLQELVNKTIGQATIRKYKSTSKFLTEFMRLFYKKDDLYLKELRLSFINDFEHFLKVNHNNKPHSAKKHIQRLKRIIKVAMVNDWLDRDPFLGYTIRCENVNREFLNNEDLCTIEQKQLSIDRLSMVRDIFIFSCYTGISYADICNLTPENMSVGIDGEKWIRCQRQKTDIPFSIPLLPKAVGIINKYSDNPKAVYTGKLLPVLSNQRMNSYLKEIADVCGISKNLTFHMARHTFATTVALSNGVPIETLSKILGHTSIRTTQGYAKVVESKISEDMRKLKEKLLIVSLQNKDSAISV